MSTGKIYIACHKPCEVPSDDVYTPIYVGRKNSKYSLEMLGDDTGDNISDRNSTYCETTAHYWVWKNVHDVDFVGFCHYRRFFNMCFTSGTFEKLFEDGTDVILASPQYWRRTMEYQWLMCICSDDLAIMLQVVHKLYPEFDSIIDKALLDVKHYPFNMLICSKKLYDEYASWLFSILFECEKYVKLSPYSRGRRVFGYMAEFLTPLFFIQKKNKIKTIDTLFKTEKGDVIWQSRWQEKFMCFFSFLWSHLICRKSELYHWTHILGLQNDGIVID